MTNIIRFIFPELIHMKWKVFFLVSVLILGQFIPLLSVYATDLSVDISASPSSGSAPLNDVDLTAVVSGSATGDITYRFDCRNDGSWERTITTSSTSYTATDLCDYSDPGNYTAKVSVERGGLVFNGTTAIFVQSGSGLSVNLSANPSSGSAPLNDVDLTANVSGSASGDITYQFDCTSDGSWERTITTSSTSYTATDLCDYSSAGNYTAKVSVERGGLSFQGTTAIVVFSGDVALQVNKLARNMSKGQNTFGDLITAEPSERIEFQIQITSIGKATAEDVIIKDTLASLLINKGNLKIDGVSSTGNIFSGLNIGDLSPNQSKTITFEAEVASQESFTFGTTNVTNTAMAYNEKTASTDAVTLKVEKKGVLGAATGVSTGLFTPFTLSLFGSLFILFILSYIFLFRFYLFNYIFPNLSQVKTERDLMKAIAKIKKKEGRIQM